MNVVAFIREIDCIGCTKCIDACPTDAIVGSAKQIHTVITNECIGCKLCIAPCPVDCIELRPVDECVYDPQQAAQRVKARKQRLAKTKNKLAIEIPLNKKTEIEAAVKRAKEKRASITTL